MTELPLCDGFDALMVVVDCFTKMSHFIPCTNAITGEGTAQLYIDCVLRHHGVPTDIISEGTQFDSKFILEGVTHKMCLSLRTTPSSINTLGSFAHTNKMIGYHCWQKPSSHTTILYIHPLVLHHSLQTMV